MKSSSVLSIGKLRALLFIGFLLPTTSLIAKDMSSTNELTLLTNPVSFFSMMDSSSALEGYSISLNKAILKNAGYTVSVESLPWARVLKRSEDLQSSIISAIARTPEREDSFFWITPISTSNIGIYMLKVHSGVVNSVEEASGWGSIAVLRGDYRHQFLKSQNTTNVMTFNRWPVAIQSLLIGRTASLFFSDLGLVLTCAEAQLNCSSIKRVFIHDQSVSYLALRKRKELEPVYHALKASAEEFKASAAFEQLTYLYLNSKHPAAQYLEIHEGIVRIKSD